METYKTNTDQKLEYAKKRVKKIKGFYVHVLIFCCVNAFIIFKKTNGIEGLQDLKTYDTAFFWGIGLLVHWLSIFSADFFLGKNWEERKINEILNKK